MTAWGAVAGGTVARVDKLERTRTANFPDKVTHYSENPEPDHGLCPRRPATATSWAGTFSKRIGTAWTAKIVWRRRFSDGPKLHLPREGVQ